MNSKLSAVFTFVVAALAVGNTGCGGHRYLRWHGAPAAATLQGKVDLVVNDRREPQRGGLDNRQIGNERNGWGIPFAIRLRTPADVSLAMRDLFGTAANSAGVGVAPMGDTAITSRLAVEIQTFWCDGYPPVYKATMQASVALLGPDNSVRMPAVPIAVEGAGWGCRAAYDKALSNAYQAAVGLMGQPGFRAAAASGQPPALPPPALQPSPVP